MIVIKHGNARGSGAMLKVDAIPCCPQSYNGHLSMTMYAQKERDSSDSEYFSPIFEDEGIAIKLYFNDITKFIEVFRGCEESICNDKGIYIHYVTSLVNIKLRHFFEPCCGYELSMAKKTFATDEEQTVSICLTPSEGLGLCLAIESMMGKIAFGM